jgi:hypothetical protein
MTKPKPEHFDRLGNKIELDDVVATAHHNGLIIARVIKLNDKMVKVREFRKTHSRWDPDEYNKYSSEMVRIPGPDATIYILKNT